MTRERWIDQWDLSGSLRALGRDLSYPKHRVTYSGPSRSRQTQPHASARQSANPSRSYDDYCSSTGYGTHNFQPGQGVRSADSYGYYRNGGDHRYSTCQDENTEMRADQLESSAMDQQRETPHSTPTQLRGSSDWRNTDHTEGQGSSRSPPSYVYSPTTWIASSPHSLSPGETPSCGDHDSYGNRSIRYDDDERHHDRGYANYDAYGHMDSGYVESGDEHDGYQPSTRLDDNSSDHDYDDYGGPAHYPHDDGFDGDGGRVYDFDDHGGADDDYDDGYDDGYDDD